MDEQAHQPDDNNRAERPAGVQWSSPEERSTARLPVSPAEYDEHFIHRLVDVLADLADQFRYLWERSAALGFPPEQQAELRAVARILRATLLAYAGAADRERGLLEALEVRAGAYLRSFHYTSEYDPCGVAVPNGPQQFYVIPYADVGGPGPAALTQLKFEVLHALRAARVPNDRRLPDAERQAAARALAQHLGDLLTCRVPIVKELPILRRPDEAMDDLTAAIDRKLARRPIEKPGSRLTAKRGRRATKRKTPPGAPNVHRTAREVTAESIVRAVVAVLSRRSERDLKCLFDFERKRQQSGR